MHITRSAFLDWFTLHFYSINVRPPLTQLCWATFEHTIALLLYIHIHGVTARSIIWLWESLSILQPFNQRCWVDARVGCMGSIEDLPACHSKWPLHKKVSCNKQQLKSLANVCLWTEFKFVQLLQSLTWIVHNMWCAVQTRLQLQMTERKLRKSNFMHVHIISCTHGQICEASIYPHNLDWQAVLQTDSPLHNWKWWKIFIIKIFIFQDDDFVFPKQPVSGQSTLNNSWPL